MGDLTIEYRVVSAVKEGETISDVIPAEAIQAEAEQTGFEVQSVDDVSFSFSRPQSGEDEVVLNMMREQLVPALDQHFRVEAAKGLKEALDGDDSEMQIKARDAAGKLVEHQFCTMAVEDSEDGQKVVVSLDFGL